MKSIDRQILSLAIPSILAGITVPLVGMVDIAVAGHLGSDGASFIGGITIGSMLFDLLYWNFAFLREGTGGITAQAFGRGDTKACAETLVRAVGISAVSALALLLLQWVFVWFVFLFIDCSPAVSSLARTYFFIRIWAAPATLGRMAFAGWFIGMQDTVRPMVSDLIVNGLNILLSLALGFGWGPFPAMGFSGVALGTVVAQYAGLVYFAVALVSRHRSLLRGIGIRHAFKGGGMKDFMGTNVDLVVKSICFIGIYIGFTLISARYGDLLLASSAICMKLFMFCSYFTDGFAYAGEAMTGKYIGMGDRPSVRLTVRHIFLWTAGISVLFVSLNTFASGPLFRLMSDDTSVVDSCRNFIPWLALVPLMGCPAFAWDGIYIGATATRAIRDSSIWALASFLAVWFAGRAVAGLPSSADPAAMLTDGLPVGLVAMHLLFLAYFSHLLARTLTLTVRYRRTIIEF